MKRSLVTLLSAILMAGCASKSPKPPAASASAAGGKGQVAAEDDLDIYTTIAEVPDPLQPINRVTFWINHQLYVYALKPVSKTYEFIMPEKGREAVYNAFENIKFPVRLTNHLLQAHFDLAARETGAFLVNSTAGIGGLGRPARHISALADIPHTDTAQTFARWGIPNGFYFVIPVMGPTTLRDGIGLVGDYALNPITWCGFIWGDLAWFIAIPAANTMRALPIQLEVYDAATKESIDRYLAARTAYIQHRNEINSKR